MNAVLPAVLALSLLPCFTACTHVPIPEAGAKPAAAATLLPSAAPTVELPQSSAFPNVTMNDIENIRLIRPGDLVSVQIRDDDGKKHMLTVRTDGFLEVPYIGKVRAAGRTCRQLAFAIKVEFEKQYFG
jgi:protein involved in polysaccharide export with SLBB domain